MNINDIQNPDEIPLDIWKAIFDKQKELLEKYRTIEEMPDSFNIDTSKTQKILKDFAWRVTEEICEAQEAKRSFETLNDEAYFTHYIEELVDALHFITELCIIAGYDETLLRNAIIPKDDMEVVYYLGLMCNCLKNKPWKQTQMLTDRPKFELYLKMAYEMLWGIFELNNMTEEDIYSIYFKKNAVNFFRIRSKY